jgi:hypothetical protein
MALAGKTQGNLTSAAWRACTLNGTELADVICPGGVDEIDRYDGQHDVQFKCLAATVGFCKAKGHGVAICSETELSSWLRIIWGLIQA